LKALITISLTLFLISCSSKKIELENKVQTLDLHYISWGCACANWTTSIDIHKYQDTGNLSEHCNFIEPDNENLKLSDTIGYSDDIVQFTGKFYVEKGFPKNYIKGEVQVDKARVFKYSNFKILKSNYKEFQKQLK
jgi:hypothetical protein